MGLLDKFLKKTDKNVENTYRNDAFYRQYVRFITGKKDKHKYCPAMYKGKDGKCHVVKGSM